MFSFPDRRYFKINFHLVPRQVVVTGSLLLTGCASVDQETAFQAVQDQVATQTGFRATWNQGTADDQKAEVAVRQTLAQPLTADDAVRVALLGNPDLQASF